MYLWTHCFVVISLIPHVKLAKNETCLANWLPTPWCPTQMLKTRKRVEPIVGFLFEFLLSTTQKTHRKLRWKLKNRFDVFWPQQGGSEAQIWRSTFSLCLLPFLSCLFIPSLLLPLRNAHNKNCVQAWKAFIYWKQKYKMENPVLLKRTKRWSVREQRPLCHVISGPKVRRDNSRSRD